MPAQRLRTEDTTPAQPLAWHLIAGSTGAGKTTYARQLAAQLGAIVFSIDDWMDTLFWSDCPKKDDLPWAMERIRRCEDQSASVARQLLQRKVPAVLDMGLTFGALRERWIVRAAVGAAPLVLHVLDPPAALRWKRVQARNSDRGDTFTFGITKEMFDLVEAMWERPKPAECLRYTDVVWHTG